MAKQYRISISIPIELIDQINEIRQQIRFNVSAICSNAIKNALRQAKQDIEYQKQIAKQVKEFKLNKKQIEYIKKNM